MLSLLLTGAGACERGNSRPDDQAESANGSESDTDREGAHSDAPPSQGDSCERDAACSSYLRCIDRTCQIPPAVTGEHDAETPRVEFLASKEADKPTADFYVELALTASERRRGLMHRREMKDGWGMLFVYPDEKKRSFWMKNTLIALDMVFMDASGEVVNVVESAEPLTKTPRPSEKPARFVLELNAGVADKSGIEPGVVMRVENIPDRHAPNR